MKNNSSTYNYADIQRYLKGEMSSAEMRQLEMAALDDPFLADALEAYKNSDTQIVSKHLDQIKAHVLSKKESSVVPLFTRYKWLSVAAVVIVLAGAAWLSFDLLNNNNKPELAQTKHITPKKQEEKKPEIDSVKTSVENDAARPSQDVTIKPQVLASRSSRKPTQMVSAERSSTDALNDSAIITSPPVALAPVMQSQVLEGKVNGVQVLTDSRNRSLRSTASGAKPYEKISGIVLDQNGNPIVGASVSIEQKATTTDKNGVFVFPADDSNKVATVSSLGMNAKKIQLKTNQANEIRMEANNQSLSEVVVTGMAKKSKGKFTAANIHIDTANVQAPAIGWMNFRKKLSSYLNEYDLGTETGFSIISFSVNSEKELQHLLNENSDNRELTQSIIDFLEGEQFWLPSSERIRLVIRIK